MKNCFLIIATALLLGACTKKIEKTGNALQQVLASQNPLIKRVMDSIGQFEVQIRFTQIDRDKDGVRFTDYDFQVNDSNYFYPASTVKFPIAVLALEKLNEMDTLSKDTRFYVEGDSVETTFTKEISKIFAISDNEASNRLLEFLGQDAINEKLRQKEIPNVRISHRLGVHNTDVATKPLVVYLNDSTTAILEGTINREPVPLGLHRIKKGIGHYADDSLLNSPFDFGLKNHYPINAQHNVLKRIIFPEKFPPTAQFNLSDTQREFLLDAMHTLPKKLGYDPKEYPDAYCKFLIYGDSKEEIPEHMKIYNKVGWAYGTLTDCAYILDERNKVEFMLTATILVNKNGIFNDDVYEFDEVGIPFLAALGREIHARELDRKNRKGLN